MDPATESVIASLGIDPATVPPGTVKLLHRPEMAAMGGRIESWSSHPNNREALAYEVETETRRHMGLVLRNLHRAKEKRSHLTEVNPTEEALWHNLTPSLPIIWEYGVAVLVEGPKDARVLYQYFIPSVAYLGPVPSPDHWTVMQRYAHTVIWIPDNEPMSFKTRQRRQQALESGKAKGLSIWEVKIPAKDAGELVKNHDELVKILRRVEEAAHLKGGGYKCPGRQNIGRKSLMKS